MPRSSSRSSSARSSRSFPGASISRSDARPDPISSRRERCGAIPSDADTFPQDVLELMTYFKAPPGQRVRAIPGAGLKIPIWILGSSLFGAQLAAELGLPYAFASHFAPALMMDAIGLYRQPVPPVGVSRRSRM